LKDIRKIAKSLPDDKGVTPVRCGIIDGCKITLKDSFLFFKSQNL